MRIIHVAPYYPPHLGGLQQAVKHLATAQAMNGNEVEVITSNKPRAGVKKACGNPLITHLYTLDIAHTPLMPGLLFTLLRNVKKGDIVHVHLAQFYVAEIVTIYSKITRNPYVLHYHGDVLPSGYFGRFMPFYKRYILTIPLKHAAAIVYPSNDFMLHAQQRYPFLKYKTNYVIPNGITLPLTPKYSNTRSNFFTASRLSTVKNVSAMIRAFALAHSVDNTLRLDIAGGGHEMSSLMQLVKELNAKRYVHFVGNLDQEQLARYYKNASCFLTTTKRETFGLSVAEAMSHGLPIVAFDAPGVRELVKNGYNGVLVEPENINAFANAITRIANDPKHRKVLSKNAVKFSKQYERQIVAQQFDQIYESHIHHKNRDTLR